MCGRSSLTKTEKEIEERFNATFYSDELERYNPLPNFNVAPTQMHPVITETDPKHLHFYRWGLIPFWARDKSIGSRMINARSETLLEKPAFKNLLKSRRCLVPFDGFYEWKKKDKTRIPYRIVTTDQEIFAVAGLWDSWKVPESNETIYSFTVITVPPNKKMKNIHDRMPAMLTRQNEKYWIDPEIRPEDALQLLLPYPDQDIKAYEVSTRVNNVRENDASLIEPVGDAPQGIQGNLF